MEVESWLIIKTRRTRIQYYSLNIVHAEDKDRFFERENRGSRRDRPSRQGRSREWERADLRSIMDTKECWVIKIIPTHHSALGFNILRVCRSMG